MKNEVTDIEKTEIENQFAELPLSYKDFAFQLFRTDIANASDFSERLKEAITLLLTDDAVSEKNSIRKNQIIDCCEGLAAMAYDIDEMILLAEKE